MFARLSRQRLAQRSAPRFLRAASPVHDAAAPPTVHAMSQVAEGAYPGGR